MECFVPNCANNTKNSPSKLFVRVREDLKKKWCQQVNAVYFKNCAIYCCEDHLDLQKDLKNYFKWKLLKDEPILKPNAVLRDDNQENISPDIGSSSSMVSDKSKDSDLMKLLLAPVTMNVEQSGKKRKYAEYSMPSTSEDLTPTKVSVGTQSGVKMVDKSTSFIARKTVLRRDITADLPEVSSIESRSSPSMFGCTNESEVTTVEETDQKPTREFSLRKKMLDLIHKNPKMYLGLPLKFLWIIDYILTKDSKKTDYLCLVLTLFKIKQNDSVGRLSDQFELSRAKISILIPQGIEVLANFFQNLIYLPPCKEIKRNLPLVFKIRFSNVKMIIDCFEIQIEKPSDPVKQAQTWSQYKNCNTIKYLVGSTPNGLVSFISAGYGGRISDKALVEESHLIDILPHNAVVMADRGFKEVEALFSSKGVKLLRPPSVFSGNKPTKEEVLVSKTIASLRVHIERVIRRLREFRLLKPHSVVNHKHVCYLDEVVIIACGLINLQGEIIKRY